MKSVETSSMRWKMAYFFSLLSASSGCCLQLILVLPLWILFLPLADAVSKNETDALITFRASNGFGIGDLNGYWYTWNKTDATPCAWIGVTCTANQTVEELDLSGWGIEIFALPEFESFPDLRLLDLSFNSIQVYSYDGILQMCDFPTKLNQLHLSSTGFNGTLALNLSRCQNLRYLGLDRNRLDTLPSDLSDLMNLQYLSLASNSFTGPFPAEELGNLSSLVSLDLSYNSFTGAIPSLRNLTSLFKLVLDNNNFTGFDESWFQDLGSEGLQHLSVSNNQLVGTIPSIIADLPNLRFLDMSRNKLSGQIPGGFSQMMGFTDCSLDLSQNQLTGEIPTDLLVPTRNDVSNCSVNLSSNLLTGNIPLNGSTFVYLFLLDLSYNNLGGPVPLNAFNNSLIYFLRLNNNQLSGDIIDVFFFGAMKFYPDMRLDNNLFTGDLSRLITSRLPVQDFTNVDIRNNNLQWTPSESIPDPINALLTRFTHALSTSYFPYSFVEFRAGGNNFAGIPLPTACTVGSINANALAVLDLSNSHLHGEILGAAFSNACLPHIRLLNLSNNHATGPLLESIFADHQEDFILDVSNNNLSGSLPTTLPSNLYNPKYFEGNDGLCGYPLPLCPQPLPKQRTAGVRWWVLLIIIGASVTVAMGSCLAVAWRWRVYHKQHQQDADLIRTLLERDTATLMALRDLKKATGNFAQSAQIGEGGFGTVYIGRLNDGTKVAIKKSKREGSEEDKAQFLNEVRILSQVNHRNLVKLMGCCMENKIALLVFEFISNGTLQEHLQGKVGVVRLTWTERFNIAVQAADALSYLHSMASTPIYHSDVKSANILLDDHLNAKVADFGISKLAPLQATHVSMVAIQGTIGYIDPEYYTSFQLTDRSDVYSFGVILLELISGNPALDFARGGQETSLVYFARPYIEGGDVEGLIDPALREVYSTGKGRESILLVGNIALKCLDMPSKARPSMQEVWKELSENLYTDLDKKSERLELHSIIEEANEDMVLSPDTVIRFDIASTDSSDSSIRMRSGPSEIQMSEIISGPVSLKEDHPAGSDDN